MMSIPRSHHKVYMFISDYNAMCTEVYRHQHIETGGNLFGLWTTSGSAIIHVMLGPGQNCKRTSTSFHQDLDYMARVGRFVNDNYMLCHIGEWHSHHNLSLSKPSAGDESTIERNFPQGMSKFLVIIANIQNRDTIKLSPYFFTNGGTRYEMAECVVLKSDSPFSTDIKILEEINVGAERNETKYGEASAIESSRNAGSNFPRDVTATPTYSQAVTGSSRGYFKNQHSSTPANDNGISTHIQPNSTSGIPNLSMDQTAAQTKDNPPESSTVQDQTASSKGVLTTREIILKEIKDDLEKYFGSEGPVDIEGAEHGEVQMTFKHYIKHWMLRFPETFPNQPVQLFCSYIPERLSKAPCSSNFIEKPLTNHVNVLLSIMQNCSTHSCKICPNVTKENLRKPASCVIPVNQKLADFVVELTNDINMTLSTPLKFAGEAQHDGSYRIEFEHYYTKWSLELPAEFPNKAAEVYKHENRCDSRQKKKIEGSRSSDITSHHVKPKPLISSDLIVSAIRSNCLCSSCWNNSRATS